MPDAVLHPISFAFGAVLCVGRFTAWLGRQLRGLRTAHTTRRALDQLPDDLLKDIGLTRCEIPFVADMDPTSDEPARSDLSAAEHGGAAHRLVRVAARLALATIVTAAASVISPPTALAQDLQVKRGKYLVTLAVCTDCHTPGYFFGKPDPARFLGGSEVGFEIPGLGVFHGPNLTPDRETGLGKWTGDEIVKAITEGRRPDGRVLAPVMPWHAFASLTPQDARAIVAFLRSLPPVKNKVPGPFGESEKPTSFVFKIMRPESSATAVSEQK